MKLLDYSTTGAVVAFHVCVVLANEAAWFLFSPDNILLLLYRPRLFLSDVKHGTIAPSSLSCMFSDLTERERWTSLLACVVRRRKQGDVRKLLSKPFETTNQSHVQSSGYVLCIHPARVQPNYQCPSYVVRSTCLCCI